MFVANLSPMAVGLLLLLGSMAVSAGITLLVVVMLTRHQERVLVEEYTASLEAFLDEMEARLTDETEDEEFAEYEARMQDEADCPDYLDYCERRLRRVNDIIVACEEHQLAMLVHPDAEDPVVYQRLGETIATLLVEQDQLRGELEF